MVRITGGQSPVKPGSSKRIKQAFHSHICGHEREL